MTIQSVDEYKININLLHDIKSVYQTIQVFVLISEFLLQNIYFVIGLNHIWIVL